METGKANKLVQTAIYIILASIYKGDTIIPLNLIDIYDLSISVDRENGRNATIQLFVFPFVLISERCFFLEVSSWMDNYHESVKPEFKLQGILLTLSLSKIKRNLLEWMVTYACVPANGRKIKNKITGSS